MVVDVNLVCRVDHGILFKVITVVVGVLKQEYEIRIHGNIPGKWVVSSISSK